MTFFGKLLGLLEQIALQAEESGEHKRTTNRQRANDTELLTMQNVSS